MTCRRIKICTFERSIVMSIMVSTFNVDILTIHLNEITVMNLVMIRSAARNMMLVLGCAFCLALPSVQAQKIAVVDINAVLSALPDYQKAQDDLDKLAQKWRQEIAQEQDIIKGMYSKYQAEQVLLSDDMKKSREDEIMNKEKAVREMQREKFGPEGALFKRRQELIKPIQERVYAAIETYADQKGYDFIFDKGGSAGLIFANQTHDKTDDIIKAVK